VISEAKTYLNKFIPPHRLISVSLFEDAHENTGKGINVCIAHTAGANPDDLSLANPVISSEIYTFDVVSVVDEDIEITSLFDEAAKKINANGG
jgi:hypothetical protein